MDDVRHTIEYATDYTKNKDEKMKLALCVLSILAGTSAYAKFCSYNSFGKRLICTSDYRSCMSEVKRVNGDECRRESDTADLPPSLKATDQKAFCLWYFDKGSPKNMGCMEQPVCEYSMRQYPQTVCAKGSLKEKSEIKKIFQAHEIKVKNKTAATETEVKSRENAIFEKGNPKEIIQLLKDKSGRLELTSVEAVTDAQKKLETFCSNDNAKACFVLYDLYGLSDFKNAWNRSAQSQCSDLKKSNEYLNRSCQLGFNEACQEVISEDDLYMGIRSNSTFIREPSQSELANNEAKGIDCKVPTASPDVYSMKKQCSKIDRSVEMCTYSKITDKQLEKMSYEELVTEGENASEHKKTSEAISFYEKACELKKPSRACIDQALAVFEENEKKGRTIFYETCSQKKLEKSLSDYCDGLARFFMEPAN